MGDEVPQHLEDQNSPTPDTVGATVEKALPRTPNTQTSAQGSILLPWEPKSFWTTTSSTSSHLAPCTLCLSLSEASRDAVLGRQVSNPVLPMPPHQLLLEPFKAVGLLLNLSRLYFWVKQKACTVNRFNEVCGSFFHPEGCIFLGYALPIHMQTQFSPHHDWKFS